MRGVMACVQYRKEERKENEMFRICCDESEETD